MDLSLIFCRNVLNAEFHHAEEKPVIAGWGFGRESRRKSGVQASENKL